MPLEVCKKCNEFKQGVTLYADDRICPDCYTKNELALKAIREERQGKSITPSRIPTPTDKRGSRKQPARQAKMAVSKENDVHVVSHTSLVANACENTPISTVVYIHDDKTSDKSHDINNGKIEKLEAIISSLTVKVNMQAEVINQLTNKLQSVMKVIGVPDVDNGIDPAAASLPSNQPSCSTGSQKCNMSLLTQEVAQMKQSICEMKQNSNSNSETKFPTLASEYEKQTSLIVHRTLQDANRRRRNVVVSGMTECDDDSKAFLDLCENNLSLKPYIIESRRIGKIRPDKPRLLLVKLRTEESAKEILKTSRQLKQSSDSQRIYINRDLSPEEAKLAYERRQRLRQQKLSGNPEILISDITVNGSGTNDNDNQNIANDQLIQSIPEVRDSQPVQNNSNNSA